MHFKNFIAALVLLFMSAQLFAQDFSIKGKVANSEGEALTGATIRLSNTMLGAVSDNKGNFILSNVSEGAHSLVVSFIGYNTKQIDFNLNGNKTLKIVLEENLMLTEEVFVYASRVGSKTPMTSTNVSNEELESRNLGQDIPYLLNLTPSFVASSDGGAGVGYTGFRIRGTDANRINVTVNGIPLNDSESHGVWWVNMPDFASSLENVQVQRGVGTSTQGAAAFGATINMQTGEASPKSYAEYSTSVGSFNTMKNSVKVGTGLINDHFAFDARLSEISSDGFIDRAKTNLQSYFISGGYYSENTIVKLNKFAGKEKTYQAWNGVPSVRLNNDLEGMKEYEDNWLYSAKETQEMIDSDSRTYNIYTYENETDNYFQDHTQLLVSHQFNEAFNFNGALHYTHGEGYYEQYKEGEDLIDYGLNNLDVAGTVIESTDLIRQKWLNNDFYGATASFNYLNEGLDLTFGGGWNTYNGRHYGKVIWAQYASNGDINHEWYRNTGDKTDYNIFAKATQTFGNLSLYGDLQYRGIDYSIKGVDDDLRDLTQNHSFDFFNPKVGTFYTIDESSSAYVSFAVANREPSRGTYVDSDPTQKTPVSEKLFDWEFGYKLAKNKFALELNAYYMNYKDQLILTGQINDVGGPVMTNVDDSYRAGIEISAGYQILENLKWDVNAAFSQNKIKEFTEYVDNWDNWETGEQTMNNLGETDIAFSPSIVANSIISASLFKGARIDYISQYVDDQFIDNTSNGDRKLDAYFVNNIRLSYAIKPSFVEEINFNVLVNNVFSEEYETNAWVYSYIYGGERYKMDGYYPQAGANVLIGMNIRF